MCSYTPPCLGFRPLLILLSVLIVPALRAAPISWAPPLNISSTAQISTNGTLVAARNAVGSADSPVVTVGVENIPFQALNFGVSATTTGTFFTANGGDTGDANLNTVLNSHVWSAAAWSFVLSGLTNGSTYQIQIIGAGDTRGCCSARNQRAGDGEAGESISGEFSRSGVGSVIGTFVAAGTAQTVRILPGLVNGTDPGISGYVLREIAGGVPMPPSDLALSNANLAPSTASGTLVGTLSTTDPNGGDTHSYSLVETASFPDNTLFTIANGSQLRAATLLGGFGSSYTVRLRTTDNTGLGFTKSFTLTVEAAQAPTALDFSANTVLQSTPPGGVVGTFSTVDPNAADAHAYALVLGTGSTHNGLFSINGDKLVVAGALPGSGAVLSIRVRSTDLSALSVEAVISLTVVNASVRVNEFLADNTSTTLADEDGDTPDWIELHNPDGGAVNLDGWYLTDNPANLTKWRFPAISIPGNGYRLVFASTKNRAPTNGSPLHSNFSLNAGGEYVGLVAPDGVTVVSEFGAGGGLFPPQKAGVSYGFFGNPLEIGFMLTPTPGAANNAGVLGFVADTKFSVRRGFHDAPFSLAITTATSGATIRYTTNGSWPSTTSGTIYTGPITVDRTLPVKAIAYKSGFVSTNIDTHTYVLVDNVVTQTSANTQSIWGLPAAWNSTSPYYGMNGNSVVNPTTHPTIRNDLKAVPTLSISMETSELFGSSGIYANPNSAGTAWERRTSLELIDPAVPDGSNNFQQNCAIRIQGGAFRSFGLTRKKSFRVLFKTDYGTSNLPTGGSGMLKYPLFGPNAAQEFNTLTFRMESNDGWQWSGANGQPQYARDQFGREVAQELGLPASHGRYMHLYLNGVYWGVYNVVERPDGSFAESYIPGADRDLWEGQNSGTPVNDSTNLDFWNTMNTQVDAITAASGAVARNTAYLRACGFNPDGTRNLSYPIWVDPNNIADYLVVNWYGGNSDWPNKNYYGGIDTQPTRTGYKYFMWDSEWSLLLRSSVTTNKTADFRGIAAPQDDLEESPEYALRYGDRVHRAMFNNGPLTPANARAIYERVTAKHRNILVPESARWGNQHGQQRGVTDWQNEFNNIVNTWFPVRTANFLAQLRGRGLYPNIDAPIYLPHGGSVPGGSGPRLSAPTSVPCVYYRFGAGDADLTDYGHSLDPRLVGGAIHPGATLVTMGGGGGVTTTQFVQTGDVWRYLDNGSDQGTAWRAAGFNDSGWASGPSELGYGDGDEATVVGFIDTDLGTAGIQKNATTYFRRVVNIPDPSIFGDFTLTYVYDDGIAVYVNGIDVARQNLPANPAYNQFATASSGDNAERSATLARTVFVPGNNIIAAEVHQDGASSSDISFNLRLTGNPPGGGGTNLSPPIPLTENGWLFSRSYNQTTGEWSALNTAFYSIDTVPASAANLVLSEFNYHPTVPTAPAETSVSTDPDDFEFVEVMNIGTQPVDLTGVSFTLGIVYDFPANTILPSNGRLVIARRAAAFTARYGTAPFGVYGGRLSNDGETLVLASTVTGGIRNFVYNDQLPWPVAADGRGSSLVLIRPSLPAPDHGLAANWAASATPMGNPGGATAIGFSGDPGANADGDAFNAFMEFALGTSDTNGADAGSAVVAGVAPFTVGMDTADFLTLTVRKNLRAHNIVSFQAETSLDLGLWSGGAAVVLASETTNADGTSTMVWRSATPRSQSSREFIRLRVAQ